MLAYLLTYQLVIVDQVIIIANVEEKLLLVISNCTESSENANPSVTFCECPSVRHTALHYAT